MYPNREKMWNSAEMQQVYEENRGTTITQRKSLIQKIKNYLKDAIIVLFSPGLASIVAFESETTKLFHCLKQDDNDRMMMMKLMQPCQKLHRKY